MLLTLTRPEEGESMVFPYECHEGNYALRNIPSAEYVENPGLAEDLANEKASAGRRRRG